MGNYQWIDPETNEVLDEFSVGGGGAHLACRKAYQKYLISSKNRESIKIHIHDLTKGETIVFDCKQTEVDVIGFTYKSLITRVKY